MKHALEVKNLHVAAGTAEIIHGVNITFSSGEVHVIMGPNGSGKSTLAQTIMGNPKCNVTQGKILFDGKDITSFKPDLRAREGLFLSFQHPVEVHGVRPSAFLRAALNLRREKPLSVVEFHQYFKEKMAQLNIDPSLTRRYLHEGLSGGEKKLLEVLQLLVLEPTFAFLDETDSGLDVDALKRVVESINTLRKRNDMGIIIITHYPRLLDYITPDKVSILCKGKIVAQGGKELAQTIEREGFEPLLK